MNKILASIFAVLSLFTIAHAQSVSDFNEGWKFHLGNASDPAKDFNHGITAIFHKALVGANTAVNPVFNDSAWEEVTLPHDWAVGLPFVKSDNFDVAQHGYKPVGGLYPATSIGWYRKNFIIAKSDSGQRIKVQFDGVFRDAQFWVNGFYVGNNKSGYIGETYDITDYVNYDKRNVFVVRVNATQYEGWFYEGAGIYRNVWLKKYNNIHIAQDGVFAYSLVNDKRTTVSTETEIVNEGLLSMSGVTVQTFLLDQSDHVVAKSAATALGSHAQNNNPNQGALRLNNIVSANNNFLVKQNVIVNAPHLWSLNDPYLYRVLVVVKQNGKIIDQVKNRFGIRTIQIKPDGVYLNGLYTKILGTNNHQDHAGVGSAMPEYLQYYRTRLLKEMGSNAIRASHNPPSPELLDACDSLGMLVLDENRLLNSSTEYLTDFKKLLKRDRSRASVFMWSIGNEEQYIQANTYGSRIATTLLTIQKQMDPTRVSTYAADLGNEFKGINSVIPVRGFNYREYAVGDYQKEHPSQPILGTEMGSTVTTRGIYEKDTINCYVPDKDVVAPWWASTAEAWWTKAAVNKYWLGGFIWTGFDYRGEPTPYQWPNINSHFGMMDMCGFPKNLYYYYQSWWSDKDVLHILPHWNWRGKEGKPVDVWVYSNADSVELFLNEISLGNKAMPLNGHLQWTVNYTPGSLKAVAVKKGKIFTTKTETTGEPASVVVSPSKTTLIADGKDVSVINISVTDKMGREVPTANNLIRFTIKGDAKIIGVGNGDPSSHEQDKCEDGKWQRSLFNGKCQLIIQAGKTSSVISFEASSDSLWKGATEIFTIPNQGSRMTVGNSLLSKNAPITTKKNTTASNKASDIIPSLTNSKMSPVKKQIGKMIGADISFLQELEDKGIEFADKGVKKDAILILKAHGFNYIRLRIFNNPASDSGYAPNKGYCDLEHTLAFAKRIKAAGLQLLLDFHYSDTWADPGKQFKPSAWKNLAFPVLKDSLYNYTKQVLTALKAQGTLPEMVQIGNEINHGMVWPDGNVSNFDGLAQLYNAGRKAVLSVAPETIIMLHIALGGQNDESVFFIDNMLARGVQFDVIGESYYPQWHGSLSDLQSNLNDLIRRYSKDVIVVEYSAKKQEVNDIVFDLPNQKGKGTFIWEPLNTWEQIFDKQGNSNEYLNLYDSFKKSFLLNK